MKKLNPNDYIGKRYGKLTVEKVFIKNKKSHCEAQCDCGNKKEFVLASLKRSLTKSCGCIREEKPNSLIYNYNKDFFKTLNRNTSYVIGLIYTDGNISKDFRKITITQNKDNYDLLLNISILLVNKNKLYKYFGRKSPSSSNITKDGYVLQLNCKEMVNDLLNWGLIPKKSDILTPHSGLIYDSDFWRGCIDGDGWVRYSRYIGKTTRFYLIIGFGGTKEMCEGFIKFCNKYVNYSPTLSKRSKNNYYEISIFGKKAIKIHNILYNESELFVYKKKCPQKFSTDKALNRDLETERKILEK